MFEWRELPCKCGFTHEKNPQEYETYDLPIYTSKIDGHKGSMKVPRCKTCQDVSILERPCLSCQMYKSDPRMPMHLHCPDCGGSVSDKM